MATLYTIGHSTRSLDELIEALQAHSIQTLVDIRSFPMSRRLPHFNRETLEKVFPEVGIRYFWMKELGGRRKESLRVHLTLRCEMIVFATMPTTCSRRNLSAQLPS